MRRHRVRLALVVVLALSVAALGATVAAKTAAAHESDCHVQQTCPSDDHSYVWSDGETQWDCALAGDQGAAAEATTIVYDGQTYACVAVGTETTEEEPPAATATPPPTPPPTPVPTPTVSRPRARPSPRPAQPRPKATQGPQHHERRATPARPHTSTPSTTQQPATPSSPFRPRFSLPPSTSVSLPSSRYVFPVDGPVSFGDSFGAPRPNPTVGWHHGEDIFAPLGTPVVAVSDGTLLKVGWNTLGGKRLWLRDRWGNYFYYAHLSGFAPGVRDGVRVRAGAVVGYVGNTGDAAGTPYHLHFEIHPASLLELGYDGVVNPYPYLRSWPRLEDVRKNPARFASARTAGGAARPGAPTPGAPTPGAILLTAADISTASGLERKSLVASASAPVPVELARRLVPSRMPTTISSKLPRLPTTVSRKLPRGQRAAQLAVVGRRALELADLLDAGASSSGRGPSVSVWDALADCESGQDWHANTGIYDGGLQFHPGTWLRYGGTQFAPYAYLATREQQIVIAERVLAVEGWAAWPTCSLALGLR